MLHFISVCTFCLDKNNHNLENSTCDPLKFTIGQCHTYCITVYGKVHLKLYAATELNDFNFSRNSDEARDCYTNVIDTFGSNCYDKEKLTEEALVIGGKINGHDLSKCLSNFLYSTKCGYD